VGHPGETTSLRSELEPILPRHRYLYYGGAWQAPQGGHRDTERPASIQLQEMH